MESYKEIKCSRHFEVMQNRISHDFDEIEVAFTNALYKSLVNSCKVTVYEVIHYETYLYNNFLGIKEERFPRRTYKNGYVIDDFV